MTNKLQITVGIAALKLYHVCGAAGLMSYHLPVTNQLLNLKHDNKSYEAS